MRRAGFLLFSFVIIVMSGREGREWMPVGSPIVATCPCKNTNEVMVWLEPGLRSPDNTRYFVYVNKTFPADSVAKVMFDSEVNITFSIRSSDDHFSRVSASEADIFTFSFPAQQGSLGFVVQGLTPGVTPRLTGFSIDGVEHCTEPDADFLEKFADTGNTPREGEYLWRVESRRSERAALARSCGRRRADSETTVDGPAAFGDWPWFTAIYHLVSGSLIYACAGTLISRNAVLTARHCTTGRKPEEVIVLVGRYAELDWSEDYISRTVARIITPDNNNYTFWNDIAILKFSKQVPLSERVQPACVWNGAARGPADQLNGTIVGWGYDDNDKPLENLQQANMPMVPRAVCLRQHPDVSVALGPNQFCAGFHQYGTSACEGDSGLAFLVFVPDIGPADRPGQQDGQVSGSWHVRGVLSFGANHPSAHTACHEGYVIFTDVDKYTAWIRSHVD